VLEGELVEAEEVDEEDGDTGVGGRADRRVHLHGHRFRYRQEDPAGAVRPSALQRPDRPEAEEGDTLIAAAITDGAKEVMMFSDAGKVIRFAESVVREMGRTARGVRGMKLGKGQQIISMLIPESGAQILTASERGFGKRTPLSKFPRRGRGGQGVIAMVTNGRNGLLVGAVQVQEGEEIMLISDQGTLVRTRVGEVSSLSRNTQGVTLIKLAKDETLVGLERIQEPSEDELDDVVETDEEGVDASR
jgi:DNA gyrase subunit A